MCLFSTFKNSTLYTQKNRWESGNIRTKGLLWVGIIARLHHYPTEPYTDEKQLLPVNKNRMDNEKWVLSSNHTYILTPRGTKMTVLIFAFAPDLWQDHEHLIGSVSLRVGCFCSLWARVPIKQSHLLSRGFATHLSACCPATVSSPAANNLWEAHVNPAELWVSTIITISKRSLPPTDSTLLTLMWQKDFQVFNIC